MRDVKTLTKEEAIFHKEVFDKTESEVERYAFWGKISHEIIHDMLNPISGLLLYLEASQYKDKIIQPIIHSNQVIQRFLKRIASCIDQPEAQEIINLQQSVEDIFLLMKPKALHHQVAFHFIRQYQANLIIANPLHLYQILMNLVSNALDAFENVKDERNRYISIVIDQDAYENILIKVHDNGIGINFSEQGKIFSTKKQSLGIGLKSAKRLTEEELGGTLHFISEPNIYTQFIVTIPKERCVS